MSQAHIGIIGGSIAGLAIANAFRHAGYKTTILERSKHSLLDRGAGICIPVPLGDALVQHNYLDADMDYLNIDERRFFVKKPLSSEFINLWQQPLKARAQNWAGLFHQLRKRYPDEQYRMGHYVKQIYKHSDHIEVICTNNERLNFDYIFACCGANSFIREQFFNTEYTNAGYIAWRGLINKTRVKDTDFYNMLTYPCYNKGTGVTYFVPSINGGRDLNWLIYQSVSNEKMQQLLTDKDGNKHDISLPPGQCGQYHIDALHELLDDFPKIFSDVVRNTKAPFIQRIFDISPKNLRQDRIALCGDGAFATRPHTGAGASKALQSALLLESELMQNNNIETALDNWAQKQYQTEKNLVELGRIFAKALVTNVPDWPKMTNNDMTQWWDSVMNGSSWYATDD